MATKKKSIFDILQDLNDGLKVIYDLAMNAHQHGKREAAIDLKNAQQSMCDAYNAIKKYLEDLTI